MILLLIFATISLIASLCAGDQDQKHEWLGAASIYVAVLAAAGIQALCDYGRELSYYHLRQDEVMSEQVQVVRG